MAETNTPSLTPEFSRIVNVARLPATAIYTFNDTPTLDEAVALADLFSVISVRKMRFQGALTPMDSKGWVLEGTLGASIAQVCVLTLETVRTRIDIDVKRVYLPMTKSAGSEISLDAVADDETEALESEIDLGLVAIEALALVIPEYPRIEGATLENGESLPRGATPIEEETAKPFAGLAALKEKLENKDE